MTCHNNTDNHPQCPGKSLCMHLHHVLNKCLSNLLLNLRNTSFFRKYDTGWPQQINQLGALLLGGHTH